MYIGTVPPSLGRLDARPVRGKTGYSHRGFLRRSWPSTTRTLTPRRACVCAHMPMHMSIQLSIQTPNVGTHVYTQATASMAPGTYVCRRAHGGHRRRRHAYRHTHMHVYRHLCRCVHKHVHCCAYRHCIYVWTCVPPCVPTCV